MGANRMQKGIRWITVIAIVGAVIAPIIPQIIWSFAHRWLFPSLLPSQWSLEAWEYIFTRSSRVGEGFMNSLAIAVFVSFLSIVVAVPAARVRPRSHSYAKPSRGTVPCGEP